MQASPWRPGAWKRWARQDVTAGNWCGINPQRLAMRRHIALITTREFPRPSNPPLVDGGTLTVIVNRKPLCDQSRMPIGAVSQPLRRIVNVLTLFPPARTATIKTECASNLGLLKAIELAWERPPAAAKIRSASSKEGRQGA